MLNSSFGEKIFDRGICTKSENESQFLRFRFLASFFLFQLRLFSVSLLYNVASLGMPIEQTDDEMSDPDLPGLTPEISSDESVSEDDWQPAYRPHQMCLRPLTPLMTPKMSCVKERLAST